MKLDELKSVSGMPSTIKGDTSVGFLPTFKGDTSVGIPSYPSTRRASDLLQPEESTEPGKQPALTQQD